VADASPRLPAHWRERPLAGTTVVVTRPADQAGALVELLEAAGATAVVVPLIRIEDDPDRVAELGRALAELGPDDWVVVASPNGATRVAPMLTGCTARIAAVGATTAANVPRVDLRPERANADGVVAAFPTGHGRVVAVQAADGSSTLTTGLAAKGWQVERFDTHRAVPLRPDQRDLFRALRADAWIVTSGSQARAWAAAFGDTTPPTVVSMGPQTTADAVQVGLKVHVTATDHSLTGAVEALVTTRQP
jgi:uroporphyrinogen-III synthase